MSDERGWKGFPFTFQMRVGRGTPIVSHSSSRDSPAPTCTQTQDWSPYLSLKVQDNVTVWMIQSMWPPHLRGQTILLATRMRINICASIWLSAVSSCALSRIALNQTVDSVESLGQHKLFCLGLLLFRLDHFIKNAYMEKLWKNNKKFENLMTLYEHQLLTTQSVLLVTA